jgi:hypothetical protein
MLNFPDAPTNGTTFSGAGANWRYDGTKWTAAGGSGVVTSITAGNGITLSPSPITSTGSVALTVPISVANGGTGATTAATAAWVQKTGDSMSGALTITYPGGPNALTVNAPTGQDAKIELHNGTTGDWVLSSQGVAAPGEFWIYNLKTGTTPFAIQQSGGLTITHPGGSALVMNVPTGQDANFQMHNGTTGDWVLSAQGVASPGEFWLYNNKTSAIVFAAQQNNTVRIGGPIRAPVFQPPTDAATDQGQYGFASANGPKIVTWGNSAAGNGAVNFYNGANVNTFVLDINGNLAVGGGTATKPGGGSWVAPSDMQLKVRDSIAAYTTGLAAITQLQPVTYQYNGKAGLPTDQTFHGLVADDVELVMPEAVGRAVLGARPALSDDEVDEPGEEYRTYDSTPVLYALINAVKELAARLEAVEEALPPGIEPLPARRKRK